MISSQITKIINTDMGLPLDEIIKAPMIRMIITDLENPIFVDKNTRLKFHTMKPNGILEVYYGEEINGEFKQFALGPNMSIPFSNIYGFQMQEVK